MTRRERRLAFLQRNRCYLCGRPFLWPRTSHASESHWQATIDHIQPRSRGGSNDFDNRAMAHAQCNERKGDRRPHPCEILFGQVNAILQRPKYLGVTA